MSTTEQAYKELLAGLVSCNSIEQIKLLVKQVLNIDENHLMFDSLVRKLCERSSINYYEDTVIDVLTNYLHTLEGKLYIRAYITKADLKNLAKAIVEKWNIMQTISMAQFKRIAQNCGYVIGQSFKSTRKLNSLIENNI